VKMPPKSKRKGGFSKEDKCAMDGLRYNRTDLKPGETYLPQQEVESECTVFKLNV
jgi:hypothetical protein